MMTRDHDGRGGDDERVSGSEDYLSLLEESERLADEEGIQPRDLDEMDAINQMRLVVESVRQEQYLLHSATSTP